MCVGDAHGGWDARRKEGPPAPPESVRSSRRRVRHARGACRGVVSSAQGPHRNSTGSTRPDRLARRGQQELHQARKPDRGVEEARVMDKPLGRAIHGRGSTDPREWALELGNLGHGSRRSRGKQLGPRLDCLRVTRGRTQGRTVPTYPRLPLTSGEKPLAYAGAGVTADR